jgi:fucose 4-O-acetylase-like acetyltransferase
MPGPQNRKDGSIETLRGLAIILMVAGHVIGDTESMGMRVHEDSSWRHFYYSLGCVRMPLFTTISGFVYALRPVSDWSQAWPCLKGKVRRLLVPLVTGGTCYYFVLSWVPGTNHHTQLGQVWRIYLYGFDHFWFVQAIFTVFVAIVLLDALELLTTLRRWLVVVPVACFVSLFAPRTSFFSFNGTLYLLPYFLLGMGLFRFPGLRSWSVVGPAVFAFVAGTAYQEWAWYSGNAASVSRESPAGLLIGVSGMLLAFRFRTELKPVAWLGHSAYSIYLLHVFGTSPGRMLATRTIRLHGGWPTFLVSLFCGLAIPVVAEYGLHQNRWLSILFLGERPPGPRRGTSFPLASAVSAPLPEPPTGETPGQDTRA